MLCKDHVYEQLRRRSGEYNADKKGVYRINKRGNCFILEGLKKNNFCDTKLMLISNIIVTSLNSTLHDLKVEKNWVCSKGILDSTIWDDSSI